MVQLTNQQHKNIFMFIGNGYNSGIKPPENILIMVITNQFNVHRCLFLPDSTYKMAKTFKKFWTGEEIIAWKHI